MSFAASNRQSEDRKSRFGVLVLVITLLFVALMGRFFYLQILRGEQFRERAVKSFIAKERLPARRGLIKDIQGNVLAGNEPAYEVLVTPRKLGTRLTSEESAMIESEGRVHGKTSKEIRAAKAEARMQKRFLVLDRLGRLLEMPHEEVDDIKLRVREAVKKDKTWEAIPLKYPIIGERCPYDGTTLELMTDPAERLMCSHCGVYNEPVDSELNACPHDRRKLTWEHGSATCTRCGRRYVTSPMCPDDHHLMHAVKHNMQCPHCRRTFVNQAALIRGELHTLPGVKVKTSFKRTYPYRYDLAHTLGYMNRVNAEDRRRERGVYGLTDIVGRRGLERSLEKLLRGEAGESQYVRGQNRANPLSLVDPLRDGTEFRPPKNGYNVVLTIDMRMQQAVKKAFRYYRSGGAVVIDPRTGAVLALYSKPGFDPNVWSGRLPKDVWEDTTNNPYTPLIHKAVTAYAPGSVYKIVTATAALETDKVVPSDTINCPGHYDFANRRFHCHYRAGHGAVTVVGALKYSCDVYFYRAAEMVGMDTLAKYGELWGYGVPVGIESPERRGRVPTKNYHREFSKQGWQPGLTLSTGIGQGALTASTLQIARSYAALVNGGSILRLRLVDRLEDDEGAAVRQYGAEELWRLPFDKDHLALIREGLVRVVNDADGTAADTKMDDIIVAGKTGTAEAAEWRAGASDELRQWLLEDHAWFGTYAPADDPQVVVVVFVEHGGSGSKMAAPIAASILRSWIKLGFYRPPGQDPVTPDKPMVIEGLAEPPSP